ncbi:hypothetical protein Nepgr_004214 [Nepenthes gracilis]|uniref:PSII 6.1 kDa protein n=1 Tax=Nepenthes gracilis TaxID=150966 RepID=A0AAD3S0X8_NEPGR|nr:hypothetical protein Nepgr_004214 [Nepenthes gracilis]
MTAAAAAITAISSTSLVARAGLVRNVRIDVSSSSPVLGLPAMARKGKVRCSVEGKPSAQAKGSGMSMGASLAAATTAAAAAGLSPVAMALVDERMTTEGTGLPFGLSNNLLAWILLGVFGLIWAFYIVYTSTLEEDEESGLSL